MNGVNGWAGWQWLFLIQGLPAAVLGVLIYFLLQDKPANADWLTSTEKNVVRYNLETDVKDIESESEGTRWDMSCDPKVCLLSLVYLVLLGATYTMVFWLPTLIQSWGVKALFLIGIYSAIPNAVGVIGMILIERNSDKWHERRWHFAACVAIAALGLGITTLLAGHWWPDHSAFLRGDRDCRRNSALLHAGHRISVGCRGSSVHRADLELR